LEKFDLVHLHHRDAAFIIPFLKLRYKVMLTLHGFGTFDLSDKWNKFKIYYDLQEHVFTSKADLLTTMSIDDKERVEHKLNKKVVYIPNGISPPRVDEGFYSKAVQTGYIMFAAARIVSFKRCDVFLKALKGSAYAGPVLVVGDLSQSSNHAAAIRNLAHGLDVTFTGLIKDKGLLMEHYKAADLFVFPSEREAMSMVLLEVASVKTPLICSNIPGNRDVFDESEVLYFESDDVNDLCKKISWALSNPEEMKRMADRAYQKILRNHSWDRISNEYSLCYDSLTIVE